jgi:hypothetical protein
MKPAIVRIMVLALAICTHLEMSHRRVRTIVRQTLDDAEPWATPRAIEKWMVKTPIRGIKQLSATSAARREVRHDPRRSGPGLLAVVNLEFRVARWLQWECLNAADESHGWRFALKLLDKRIEAPRGSFHLDLDTLGAIADPTGETMLCCQPKNERTKPDSLHRAVDKQAQAPG